MRVKIVDWEALRGHPCTITFVVMFAFGVRFQVGMKRGVGGALSFFFALRARSPIQPTVLGQAAFFLHGCCPVGGDGGGGGCMLAMARARSLGVYLPTHTHVYVPTFLPLLIQSKPLVLSVVLSL